MVTSTIIVSVRRFTKQSKLKQEQMGQQTGCPRVFSIHLVCLTQFRWILENKMTCYKSWTFRSLNESKKSLQPVLMSTHSMGMNI